ERVNVPGGERVVEDAANDARLGAFAVSLDQRVEVILPAENVRHPAVGVEQSDAADAPVAAAGGDLVGVERHVGAMEAAYAEVEDARLEGVAAVARDRQAERADRVET